MEKIQIASNLDLSEKIILVVAQLFLLIAMIISGYILDSDLLGTIPDILKLIIIFFLIFFLGFLFVNLRYIIKPRKYLELADNALKITSKKEDLQVFDIGSVKRLIISNIKGAIRVTIKSTDKPDYNFKIINGWQYENIIRTNKYFIGNYNLLINKVSRAQPELREKIDDQTDF